MAAQPALAWKVNDLQLLDPNIRNNFLTARLVLEIGGTENIPGEGNRTTLTIPASVAVNDSIDTIVCQAGPTEFILTDGDIITFTVYGECVYTDRCVYVCVAGDGKASDVVMR